MIFGILSRSFLIALLLAGLEAKAGMFQTIVVLTLFIFGTEYLNDKEEKS
jgi:uncharacterized membrane protein